VLLACEHDACRAPADVVLFALFGALLVSAILVTAVGIHPLPRAAPLGSGALTSEPTWCTAIARQLRDGRATLCNPSFVGIALMIFANGLDGAFIFGDFTGDIVTPVVGEVCTATHHVASLCARI
jgi:hypothetical protein